MKLSVLSAALVMPRSSGSATAGLLLAAQSAALNESVSRDAVDLLGDEARAAWPKLAVGKYCEPLKTSVGIYIIKPLSLTDDDVRDVLRKQHEDSIRDRVAKEFKAAMAQAKIEYAGKSVPAVGGPTSKPDRVGMTSR